MPKVITTPSRQQKRKEQQALLKSYTHVVFVKPPLTLKEAALALGTFEGEFTTEEKTQAERKYLFSQPRKERRKFMRLLRKGKAA